MAHKALRPPIEPLSDAAWQRIADVVLEQLGSGQLELAPSLRASSREPRMAPLLAAASLGVSALVVATATQGLMPKWSDRVGVELARNTIVASSTRTPPAVEERAPRPSAKELADEAAQGQSAISTADESMRQDLGSAELVVAPRSKIRYRGSDIDGWLVVVESGRVHCQVAPRKGRPDFVVRAGSAEVRVVGTRFDVAYRGGRASVSVAQGHVLVLDRGQQTLLHAGERWPIAKSSPAAAADQSRPAKAVGKPKAASVSARQDFELATSLESAEPERALSIYQRLSNSGGAWAANALYAQARLLKEAGHDVEATRLLSRYIELYPRGSNAADARRLLNANSTSINSSQ